MIFRERLIWARAFIDQARLDSDLAQSLYQLVTDEQHRTRLGSKPELYCPAIYAYCQQAIEKALKALLWYEKARIPKKHNPLGAVLALRQMSDRRRPAHLDLIHRNARPVEEILNMAPGAASDNPSMTQLLGQANTEYPFAGSDGAIRLPCQEIAASDAAAALKIAGPVVHHIRKYLEVAGLAPSSI